MPFNLGQNESTILRNYIVIKFIDLIEEYISNRVSIFKSIAFELTDKQTER